MYREVPILLQEKKIATGILLEGVTYVRARDLIEGIGLECDWDQDAIHVDNMRPVPDLQIAPSFSLNEFRCKCCGRVMVNDLFVELVGNLQALRDRIGRPITITSGYRCPEHNSAVGGVPDSQHTKGTAADMVSELSVTDLAQEARAVGFRYVEEYPAKGFVHVDMRR